MFWNKQSLRTRLRVASFLFLLLGGATFLAVTDNDEGRSLWQRWTSSSTVGAAGSQDLLLKQIATIDLPGPKGKRFDYLTIDPRGICSSPPTWARGCCMRLTCEPTNW